MQAESRPIAPHADIYRQLLPIFRQACEDQSRLGDQLAALEENRIAR